jgi:kynureninase
MHALTLEDALRLDAADELAALRDEFVLADPELIYLDGNSLGRLPKHTVDRLRAAVLDEWGADLIRGWGDGWYEAPQRIGDTIGQLIGAAPGQVLVCDSTSVNLFKLATAALRARPGRTKVISDALNFPSDLYIVQGCIDLLGAGHQLHLQRSHDDELTVDEDELLAQIDDHTALVTLSHVTFKSGFVYDAARISARAHEVGALVLWDLSHSAGAVPVALDEWGADLAVGCCYKYLNGGPGAPAYLYVRQELQEALRSPIWGWFGQRTPFAFDLRYTPAPGLARFLAGTPPMLALEAIEPAVEMLARVGIPAIRRKSVALTEFMVALHDALLAPLGFTLGSPRNAERRGSHVSVRHPQGYQINQALIAEMNVLPDFREPDNLRLGFSPLTTSFAEVWHGADRIRRTVKEGRHERYPAARRAVT